MKIKLSIIGAAILSSCTSFGAPPTLVHPEIYCYEKDCALVGWNSTEDNWTLLGVEPGVTRLAQYLKMDYVPLKHTHYDELLLRTVTMEPGVETFYFNNITPICGGTPDACPPPITLECGDCSGDGEGAEGGSQESGNNKGSIGSGNGNNNGSGNVIIIGGNHYHGSGKKPEMEKNKPEKGPE